MTLEQFNDCRCPASVESVDIDIISEIIQTRLHVFYVVSAHNAAVASPHKHAGIRHFVFRCVGLLSRSRLGGCDNNFIAGGIAGLDDFRTRLPVLASVGVINLKGTVAGTHAKRGAEMTVCAVINADFQSVSRFARIVETIAVTREIRN